MTYIQYCSSHHWNSGFFYDNICLYNLTVIFTKKGASSGIGRETQPPALEYSPLQYSCVLRVFIIFFTYRASSTVLRIKVPIRIYPCHIIHGRCNRCFILVSSAAALRAITPQPQIPMIPILSGSASSNRRKSTANHEIFCINIGEAMYLGLPPLPVKEGDRMR